MIGHLVKGYRLGITVSIHKIIKESSYIHNNTVDPVGIYYKHTGNVDISKCILSNVSKLRILSELTDIINSFGYGLNNIKVWGDVSSGLIITGGYIDITISLSNISIKNKDWFMYVKYKRKQYNDICTMLNRWLIEKQYLINGIYISLNLKNRGKLRSKVIYIRWSKRAKKIPYQEVVRRKYSGIGSSYTTYIRFLRYNVSKESLSAIRRRSSGIPVVDRIVFAIKISREYDRKHIRMRKSWDRLIKLYSMKGRIGKKRMGTWYGGNGYYGYRIVVKGTIEGSRRGMSYVIIGGKIPYSSIQAYTKYSSGVACTTVGTRGISVEYCYGT